LEEFGRVIAPGGAGIVIASMAGHFIAPFTPEQETALAHTPAHDLLRLPFTSPDVITDPIPRTQSPSAPTRSKFRQPA
jgi:hypothetical protein